MLKIHGPQRLSLDQARSSPACPNTTDVLELHPSSGEDSDSPLGRVVKAKVGSSHIVTRAAWVQFPPSPTHNTCLLCSAVSGIMKLVCLPHPSSGEDSGPDDAVLQNQAISPLQIRDNLWRVDPALDLQDP